jgi:hypothetical protein
MELVGILIGHMYFFLMFKVSFLCVLKINILMQKYPKKCILLLSFVFRNFTADKKVASFCNV